MHWTKLTAKQNYKDGLGKWTIFPRSGNHHQCVRDIYRFFDALQLLYPIQQLEKVRVALQPDKDGDFLVMEYCQDGTYWVRGYLVYGGNSES